MRAIKTESFTLMEILVTIIIISVFASIAVTSYTSVMARAEENRAAQELKTLNSANEIYRAKNSVYWGDVGVVKTAAEINAGLRLELPEAGSVTYSYEDLDLDRYYGEADVARYNFKLRVHHLPISSTNPCCYQGDCPTITAACAVCGDGIIGPGEECDDGNVIDGDGCSASCGTEP